MERLLKWLGFAVLAVVLVMLDRQFRETPEPRVVRETQTDTVRVTERITERDTITTTVPERVTIYERETDTVNVCRSEPRVGYDTHGFITRTPLRIDRHLFSSPTVTLTYWKPDSTRFEQTTYEVPRADWRLWPGAGAEYGTAGLAVDARLNLEWQKVHAYAGYELTGYGHGVLAGIRVRPFTLSW